MIYKVRRLNKNSWAGIDLFDLCKDRKGPGVDDVTALPITGLTEDREGIDDKGRTVKIPGTRKLMEKKLGMEEGALAVGSLYKLNPFWLNFTVDFGAEDLELDDEIPDHELKLHFLRAQPWVACNFKDRRAKQEYVLFTDEDEAKASTEAKSHRRKAYSAFDKLTKEDQAEILMLSGTNPDSLSPQIIEDKLSDWMETNPERFLAVVKDPMRPAKLQFRLWMDMALVTLEDDIYMYGSTHLGRSIDTAVGFLAKEENKGILDAIRAQANEQKRK